MPVRPSLSTPSARLRCPRWISNYCWNCGGFRGNRLGCVVRHGCCRRQRCHRIPALAETHLAATAEYPLPTHTTVLAQAVDAGRLNSQLVDGVGILSADDEQAINDELKQLQQSDRIQFYIVYTDTFGGMSAQEYAETTAAANGGGQAATSVCWPLPWTTANTMSTPRRAAPGAKTNSMLLPPPRTTS